MPAKNTPGSERGDEKPEVVLARTGREMGVGFAGQQRAMLSSHLVNTLVRKYPLLRFLTAVGAGYFPRAAGHLRRRPEGSQETIFIYCVKGTGWCDIGDCFHAIRTGDMLVLPAHVPHSYGAHPSTPWSIHWAHASGECLLEFLKEMQIQPSSPVVRIGEDLQIISLFGEIRSCLAKGTAHMHLLQASQAMGHLLSLVVRHVHDPQVVIPDTQTKIGQSVMYINEHLSQPLQISRLAAMVNVSPAHFSVLFREATGSSPRDYLQLLRLHKACELLRNTTLELKQIAAQIGYQDPLYFSRQFKSLQGISPSRYRALYLDKEN